MNLSGVRLNLLDYFELVQVIAASIIPPNALVGLVFEDTRVDFGSVGDACACELMRRRLLPDVCSYCVYRNASVSVTRSGLIVARVTSPTTFFSRTFGFSDTEEVKYRNARLFH